jgi:hypothetical protein
MKKNKIQKLLDFDSLNEAEKITGKSYKNDDDTTALGFLMHIENSKQRKN